MTITEYVDAPVVPDETAQPAKLGSEDLRRAQARSRCPPRMRYSLLARLLFTTVDLVYGTKRSLVKFAMLEFIARVPYQAWERMGYWRSPVAGVTQAWPPVSWTASRTPACSRTTSSGTC